MESPVVYLDCTWKCLVFLQSFYKIIVVHSLKYKPYCLKILVLLLNSHENPCCFDMFLMKSCCVFIWDFSHRKKHLSIWHESLQGTLYCLALGFTWKAPVVIILGFTWQMSSVFTEFFIKIIVVHRVKI